MTQIKYLFPKLGLVTPLQSRIFHLLKHDGSFMSPSAIASRIHAPCHSVMVSLQAARKKDLVDQRGYTWKITDMAVKLLELMHDKR